jgi:predicted N-acetyltransferase YhbS
VPDAVSSPRPLREDELDTADAVFRRAFGTFLGLPEPMSFGGDSDFVRTRWRAGPDLTLALDHEGELAGTNFVTQWGTVGFFGPLTVRPDLWDRGVASRLMTATTEIFDARDVTWSGLFTFGDSAKHVGLYSKFGFEPQDVTTLFRRPVSGRKAGGWSTLEAALDPEAVMDECAEICGQIYDGFDPRREMQAVLDQRLGEVVVLDGSDRIDGFAICHIGAGTEAGSGNCYVKLGLVRPHGDSDAFFRRLLEACDTVAGLRGATSLLAGMNRDRAGAHAAMGEAGFEAGMQGLVMTRPDARGYNREDVFLIDDWR